MPVPAQATLFNESVANGVTTSFPYQFMIASADDLAVELDGVATTTGFTVTGVGDANGGNVVFSVAPANGVKVLRYLDSKLNRTEDYQQFGDFNAETVNREFNRLWLAMQSHALKLGRCVRAPISSSTGIFPEPAANNVIGWNSSANGFLNYPRTGSDISFIEETQVADDGQTVFTLESATYLPGANNISVYVNGLRLSGDGVDYSELSSSTVEMTTGLALNDEVVFVIGQVIGSGLSSSVVAYTAKGDDALPTNIQDVLRETVSASRFIGFDLTGENDSTAAILSACASLGELGGSIEIPIGAKVLIDSDLEIPANCHLVGPHKFVGSPGNNTAAPYGDVGGCLIVNPSKTITLGSGANISGLLIYRKGMVFPAADASGFSGTAITIGGDDAGIERSMILGFNKAIYSSGYQRPKALHCLIDCVNGIEITNCYDIPNVGDVHCWPFSTIATYAAGGSITVLQRSGRAFYLHDVADWAKLTNCFAYGYKYSYDIDSVNAPTLLSCSADGTSGASIQSGSRAFQLRGTTNDAKLLGCQAASQEIGFYNDTVADTCNHLSECIAWAGSTHGFFFGAGDAVVTGGAVYGVTNGVSYTNNASRVTINGLYIGQNVPYPINTTVNATTDKLVLNKLIYAGTASGNSPISGSGSLSAPSIASAGQLNIPATGEEFLITGTTNIGGIHEGWAGRQITLVFSGVLSVVHGTGAASSIKLNGSVNFTTAVNSTLTLKHNGTQWFEIGRSA